MPSALFFLFIYSLHPRQTRNSQSLSLSSLFAAVVASAFDYLSGGRNSTTCVRLCITLRYVSSAVRDDPRGNRKKITTFVLPDNGISYWKAGRASFIDSLRVLHNIRTHISWQYLHYICWAIASDGQPLLTAGVRMSSSYVEETDERGNHHHFFH